MCTNSSSDGNTDQKGRTRTILSIEREEPTHFSFLLSYVLPVKGRVWLDDLGGGGDPFPEGLSCEKEKKRLLEQQKTE